MIKPHKWFLENHDPSTALSNKQIRAFDKAGIVPDNIIPATGDNPQRKEYILTEDQLSGISGMFDTYAPSPRKQSIDRIMNHAYSYDYDRPKLIAGLWFVVASFLFIDAVAIALLIKFVL
jgi:hypothetical protein